MNCSKKNKFKDKHLNELYQFLIKNPPFNSDGSKNYGSSLHEFFWKGYSGVSYKFVVPFSNIHAAWAAGKEYKKISNK